MSFISKNLKQPDDCQDVHEKPTFGINFNGFIQFFKNLTLTIYSFDEKVKNEIKNIDCHYDFHYIDKGWTE